MSTETIPNMSPVGSTPHLAAAADDDAPTLPIRVRGRHHYRPGMTHVRTWLGNAQIQPRTETTR